MATERTWSRSIITKRIGAIAVAFACLFTASAAAQYIFLKQRLFSIAKADLTKWAAQIDQEIGFQDKWNLKGFRHADIEAPNFAVFTADGMLIEVYGFSPGILPAADPLDPSSFGLPNSVRTEVRETMRILGTRVRGGAVLMGVVDVDDQLHDLPAIDDLLTQTSKKFGSTLASASRIEPRDIDGRIEYAVLADTGEIEFAVGTAPLKLRLDGKVPTLEATDWRTTAGKKFLRYQKPILDNRGQAVAEIMLFKDFTDDQLALHQIGTFNLWLALACWAVAVTLVAVPLVRYELERRSLEISLEEALRKGEGQSIEFKLSIHDEDLAKLVAAFANTNPGNIFIGVADNGGVTGMPQETLQQRDALLRRIQQIIKRMVQPPVAPSATFIPHGGRVVLRLFVPTGNHPPYVVQGTVWIRRLAEVVAADRQEIIERAIRAR